MSGTTFLLPKSHLNATTWATLITKQKALRLHSLLTSPSSFSSSYDREVAFTDTDWEARLKNPIAYTFIATASPLPTLTPTTPFTPEDDLTALISNEWVGSAVLIGPADINPEYYGEKTVMYDVDTVFVVPEARGRGLGRALMEACMAHARTLAAAAGMKKVVVRVKVATGNERVLELYQRIGFERQSLGMGHIGLIKWMDV